MKTSDYQIENFKIKVLLISLLNFLFRVTKSRRENRSASVMMSTFVYRYRGFNCRKKQFSRSYRNNLNSAWKKINAACLPFITNVCSLPRRLSYAFAECKMRARRRNSMVLTVRFPMGQEKGENWGEAGYNHCRGLCDLFFVSRNAFFHIGACVIQL